MVGGFVLGFGGGGGGGVELAEKLRVRSGKTRWGLDLGFKGGRKGRGFERKREDIDL